MVNTNLDLGTTALSKGLERIKNESSTRLIRPTLSNGNGEDTQWESIYYNDHWKGVEKNEPMLLQWSFKV